MTIREEPRPNRFLWTAGDFTVTDAEGVVVAEADAAATDDPVPDPPVVTVDMEAEIENAELERRAGTLDEMAYGRRSVP